MTNKIIYDIMASNIESFNNSAPAEFAIVGNDYIKFCDTVESRINKLPINDLNIESVMLIITKSLTEYAEDKIGKNCVMVDIRRIQSDGSLRIIADNAIRDSNICNSRRGCSIRLDNDEFYTRLVALLENEATDGEMSMLAVNQTAASLICKMTDEAIAVAS